MRLRLNLSPTLACLIGTGALALAATADVAVMRTGVVHEGTLNRFDADELVLTIPSGRIILDRADIASVHFGLTAAQYKQYFSSAANPAPGTNTPPNTPHQPSGAVNPPAGTRVGQPYNGGHFALTLVSAKIGMPNVSDLFKRRERDVETSLILTFRVDNPDDRRIVRYEEPNPFLGRHFSLTDDAGNAIRIADYGLGSTIVGALDGNADILPGEYAQHVEVFSAPPPLTKSLVLHMRNSAFGGSGTSRFVILPSDITGFQGAP